MALDSPNLNLWKQRLGRVPDALDDLDGLTDFLYLHDNQLTSLPSSLARLTKLRYINVGENAFDIRASRVNPTICVWIKTSMSGS
jgi:Leucine-rich repeat (LRR) protein